MITVEDIGNEEAALNLRMPVNGFIEYRDEYLSKYGLYDEWRAIYGKYVALVEIGDIEAMKRAMFYAWYQLAEPSWLSGIRELPDEQTRLVLSVLEEHLSRGLNDGELAVMLPYYLVVCDYYLERFYPLPCIQKASVMTKNSGRPVLNNTDWVYRGKMGEYWGA